MYNIPFLFELEQAVDIQKLANAITEMVNAHSYLLTKVYLSDAGEMVQRPCNETFVPEVIETTEEEFARLKEKLVRPFKLEKGRLFRAAIYHTEDRSYLFTDFHHITQMAIPTILFLKIITEPILGEKPKKKAIRI